MRGGDFGMDARSPRRHSPNPSAAAAVLAGFALLTGGGICRADDAQELELGKNRFDAGRYDEAHARLSAMLDASLPTCEKASSGSCRISDTDLIERARALDAASLIALKRYPEAEAQIETILRQNPTYAPNPALFPQEVVDRFTQVRGRLRDELEKEAQARAARALQKRLAEQQFREAQEKWIGDVQRLAALERRVEINSRWVALLPLGIGQYQNGDTRLGVFFTASELLLGATTLVSAGVIAGYDKVKGKDCTGACLSVFHENVANAALVNRIAFGGWLGITLIGIAQAQIAFVPERHTYQPRPIPPRPKLAPTVSLEPGGLGLGLVGRF
jgi:tetratricopeptide (TPR) repeat protein